MTPRLDRLRAFESSRCAAFPQKRNFIESCAIRGSPAVEIRPKVGEASEAEGVPKFVWFSTLKYSARNCRSDFSVMLKLRARAVSKVAKLGARKVFFRTLP